MLARRSFPMQARLPATRVVRSTDRAQPAHRSRKTASGEPIRGRFVTASYGSWAVGTKPTCAVTLFLPSLPREARPINCRRGTNKSPSPDGLIDFRYNGVFKGGGALEKEFTPVCIFPVWRH